ncbi:hypothetical protein HS041_20190 [Planomonospora sp. ID67723]|uniref:hypothetical protein n=1 Tax=Planomonospora sp. ID67723 TaxID=2738134 RepID=UPI0018C367A7|nr:hypothetical protein [Planomonospora sp. ID67723]MBG0830091.1 hypothetical protein [Planomonospora sp. ID67723]
MSEPKETEAQKKTAAGDYAATKQVRTEYGYRIFSQFVYPDDSASGTLVADVIKMHVDLEKQLTTRRVDGDAELVRLAATSGDCLKGRGCTITSLKPKRTGCREAGRRGGEELTVTATSPSSDSVECRPRATVSSSASHARGSHPGSARRRRPTGPSRSSRRMGQWHHGRRMAMGVRDQDGASAGLSAPEEDDVAVSRTGAGRPVA